MIVLLFMEGENWMAAHFAQGMCLSISSSD